MKKITSVTLFRTDEGIRVSATYSEINGAGIPEKSNVRFGYVADDEDGVLAPILATLKADALAHLEAVGE